LKDLRTEPKKNKGVNNLIVDCKNSFLRKPKAAVTNNNDTMKANGKNLEALCEPAFLKKHGLQPIPVRDMGPKKNKWIK